MIITRQGSLEYGITKRCEDKSLMLSLILQWKISATTQMRVVLNLSYNVEGEMF